MRKGDTLFDLVSRNPPLVAEKQPPGMSRDSISQLVFSLSSYQIQQGRSMRFNGLFVGTVIAALCTLANQAVAQQASTATGVKQPVAVPSQNSAETGLTPAEAEVAAAGKKLVDAFNQGNTAQAVELFLPDAELIDDTGTVYLGKDEIGALIKSFFDRFPGVQTASQIESIRLIAGLALVDGSRTMLDKEGKSFSLVRYTSIWKKTDAGYKIVSLRDVAEQVPPSPKEALETISWLVGSWVNEGSDGSVNLDYRLAEEGNFIVGDVLVNGPDGRQVMKSFQRIAWDASQGTFRSWTFDSDGGWGESLWSPSEQGWTLESKAFATSGAQGSVRVTIVPETDSRLMIQGTNRLSNGVAEPDYQHVMVRKAPTPSN
jgi:ketosteroid isomerase-like protein